MSLKPCKAPRLPTHGRRSQINAYLPPYVLDEIEVHAEREQRSLSAMMNILLGEALSARKGKK